MAQPPPSAYGRPGQAPYGYPGGGGGGQQPAYPQRFYSPQQGMSKSHDRGTQLIS